MKVAVRFLEEWRLAEWVIQANEDKAVAPPTRAVLERYEERVLLWPDSIRPPRMVMGTPQARKFAERWRARWGARWCRVRTRPDVSVGEIQAKAVSGKRCLAAQGRVDSRPYLV